MSYHLHIAMQTHRHIHPHTDTHTGKGKTKCQGRAWSGSGCSLTRRVHDKTNLSLHGRARFFMLTRLAATSAALPARRLRSFFICSAPRSSEASAAAQLLVFITGLFPHPSRVPPHSSPLHPARVPKELGTQPLGQLGRGHRTERA